MSFFSELQRRNVFRVTAAYLAFSWVVIEVTGAVVPALHLPDSIPSIVIWLCVIGFPFIVMFSWVYELTPEGLKRESEVDRSQSITQVTSKRLDYIIIAMLAVAIGLFVLQYLHPSAPETPASSTEVATTATSSPVASTVGPVLALENRPAIAVLPFENLSPDAEQAFFADGLAEDLITRLSAWRAFPVIAGDSSFRYRGRNVDLKRVSAELGARYIVKGSVRRAGDRIRVTAQLIDASSGEHVWAETFDRDVKDVFAVQDEISATIAASLVDDLAQVEGARARARGTETLEAWSLYQVGMQYYDRQTAADYAKARALFERAVELDPRFATAQARLALTDLWTVAIGASETPEEQVAAALALARRAVESDRRDPVAHVAVAWAQLLGGDLAQGLDSARRAVELNPSMPEGWSWLGWMLVLSGDTDGSIAATERGRRLSPQGQQLAQLEDNDALAYFESERYEQGLEAGRRLVSLRPDYVWGHMYVAANAAALGRLDEAREAVAELRRLDPQASREVFQRGIGISRPAIDAHRNEMLLQAGLE
jgi:adenylate cyclase